MIPEHIDILLSDADKKRLNGYTYCDDYIALKTGYFVRYIKQRDDKYYVVVGGKIDDLVRDKKDRDTIYKIGIKSNIGTKWYIRVTADLMLFYKGKSVTEERNEKIEEWKKSLSPLEAEKFAEMKKTVLKATSNQEKKKLRDEYYNWLADNRIKESK